MAGASVEPKTLSDLLDNPQTEVENISTSLKQVEDAARDWRTKWRSNAMADADVVTFFNKWMDIADRLLSFWTRSSPGDERGSGDAAKVMIDTASDMIDEKGHALGENIRTGLRDRLQTTKDSSSYKTYLSLRDLQDNKSGKFPDLKTEIGGKDPIAFAKSMMVMRARLFEILNVTSDDAVARWHLFSPAAYESMQSSISNYLSMSTETRKVNRPIMLAMLHALALRDAISALDGIEELVGQLKDVLSGSSSVRTKQVKGIMLQIKVLCNTTWSADAPLDLESGRLDASQNENESDEINIRMDVPALMKGGGAPSISDKAGRDGERVERQIHGLLEVTHARSVHSIVSRTAKMSSAYTRAMARLRDLQFLARYIETSGKTVALREFVTRDLSPGLTEVISSVDQGCREYMAVSQRLVNMDQMINSHEKLEILKNMRESNRSMPSSGVLMSDTTQLMIALKLVRFGAQVIALKLAALFYLDRYNAYVAGTTGNEPLTPKPPPLMKMLLMFLGIDAAIQLCVTACLVGAKFMNDAPSDEEDAGRNIFIIDDEFLMLFLADYFITTAVIAVIGATIVRMFMRKKYVDLAKVGSSAINAFRSIMTGVSGVADAIPFFILM